MTYSIFDAGNLVESFDRGDAAEEALARLAQGDSETSDRLLLVAFDGDGKAVADCVPGERLGPVA